METDLQLLSRYHRQGDAGAFQSLVHSHAGMVHATAVRVTRDFMLAQDVAQETFLALARSGGAAIQSVGAWLHHVAWQKARDCVRGESRRKLHESAAAEHLHQPGGEATWTELEPMLDEAINELPNEAKAMLISRFFRDQTQQQIAAEMGVSQSKVSRVLDQGIAGLRAKLRARGLICGAGLASLMSAHGVQAAPPALIANLGKLALSGVGAATTKVTFTQTLKSILMTPAAKLTLATAAVLTVAAVGHDLASANSTVRNLFSGTAPGAASDSSSTASGPNAPLPPAPPVSPAVATSPTKSAAAPVVSPAATATVKAPSPELLAKFDRLKKESDFKAFVLRLFASRDSAFISQSLMQQMGIAISPDRLTRNFPHVNFLEVMIVSELAIQHPVESLAWLAMYEGTTNMMSMNIYREVFKRHPEITADSLAATLPPGVHRDQVLGILRAQQDPVTEANRVLATQADPKLRSDQFWQLANLWPANQAAAGLTWAMANLRDQELRAFVPELAQQFSVVAPDDTLAFLSQISDAKLLALSIGETLEGIVLKHHRPGDLLPLINKLSGTERAYAVGGLAKAWVSVDQDSLVQWLNTVESPADFDAMLPYTLPKLSEANYDRAMTSLMSQLDTELEAALIKTAMPNNPQSTRTTMDIISRITALPHQRQIGPGGSANQNLLWQAVNQNAAGWITKQGASPADGARWIDTLPFRSANDKATVAAKLYEQWKRTNPAAAAQWARSAGVAFQ